MVNSSVFVYCRVLQAKTENNCFMCYKNVKIFVVIFLYLPLNILVYFLVVKVNKKKILFVYFNYTLNKRLIRSRYIILIIK